MARSRTVWRIKRTLRTTVTAIGKRVPFVHAASRSALTSLRARRWARMCDRYAVEPTTAIFESYSGRNFSCSPRGLFEAMVNDPAYDGFTKVWAFKAHIVRALALREGFDVRGMHEVHAGPPWDGDLDELFGARALAELKKAVIVSWGSPEYYRTYARAALWVSNARIPAHLIPREGQTFVQTWHGTPLKRLGYDIPQSASSNATYSYSDLRRHYGLEGARLTYLLTPSKFTSEKLATAFNLVETGRTSTIVEEGYPRNDRLKTFSADELVEIRERLDLPADKKLILYAPTWRDNQHTAGVGYTLKPAVDFERLRRELGDEYLILFRAHYLVANDFDFEHYEGFVRNVSLVSDINDLYLVSDVLVTDYSSVFFDYANLSRPIIFFMYDLDAYAEDIRGFYLDLSELPGPIVRTEDELLAAIRTPLSEDPLDAEKLARFQARFNYLDDGHASERVLARVMHPA
jgi:CDP-glycerol glycerophosphotransferase